MSTIIVIASIREYVRRFRASGATSPGAAKTLPQIGCKENAIFRCLVAAGVIMPGDGPAYYLREKEAATFLARNLVIG